jgi:anti-sigma regulatory factor (Ser/Thr protein kinase)
MEPDEKAHMCIEMLSQPRYLSGVRMLVSAVAQRLGFDEAGCGQIALAVDEALCNVIRHGYQRSPKGKIWIRIWPVDDQAGDDCSGAALDAPLDQHRPKAGGIKLVIEDLAQQVDPDDIRSRSLEEVRPGGLGVHIMREIMDEVRFERRAPDETGDRGVGMRLTMIKRRPDEMASENRAEEPTKRGRDASA